MTTDLKFIVWYYNVPFAVIYAPTRVAACIQMGARFGGTAGLSLRPASES